MTNFDSIIKDYEKYDVQERIRVLEKIEDQKRLQEVVRGNKKMILVREAKSIADMTKEDLENFCDDLGGLDDRADQINQYSKEVIKHKELLVMQAACSLA